MCAPQHFGRDIDCFIYYFPFSTIFVCRIWKFCKNILKCSPSYYSKRIEAVSIYLMQPSWFLFYSLWIVNNKCECFFSIFLCLTLSLCLCLYLFESYFSTFRIKNACAPFLRLIFSHCNFGLDFTTITFFFFFFFRFFVCRFYSTEIESVRCVYTCIYLCVSNFFYKLWFPLLDVVHEKAYDINFLLNAFSFNFAHFDVYTIFISREYHCDLVFSIEFMKFLYREHTGLHFNGRNRKRNEKMLVFFFFFLFKCMV